MALLMEGLTTCTICGKTIEQDQQAVMFAPFVQDENDPLYFFRDGAFHEKCILSHPQGPAALERMAEWMNRVSPKSRYCAVCGELIIDPENHLLIEHLSSDPSDILARFNYTHLHRTCLASWSDRAVLIEAVKEKLSEMKSKYLERVLIGIEGVR